MKSTVLLVMFALMFASCQQVENPRQEKQMADTTDATNNFYDNASTYSLDHKGDIRVEGEVSDAGEVSFEGMPLRSVVVKETRLHQGEDDFVGAYCYQGYSLSDLLDHVAVDKANKEEFAPIIDLFVMVTNEKGDTAVLSWGEIYYPNNRHQILIATRVTPVLPSKTNEQWPIPENSRLVVANDLITERNIKQPTRISVHSLKAELKVNRDMEKMYAPAVDIYHSGQKIATFREPGAGLTTCSYANTFYGRGRGIHGITRFKGYLLKELLPAKDSMNRDYIRKGLYTIAAPDGYRAAFTYSEIMNRNDQSEALLIDRGSGTDDRRWRLFMSADFFSDRAIKSVSQVHLNLQ